MISELFSIGSFSISPYGVLLVVALAAAYFQLRWGMNRLGVGGEEDANAVLLAAAIGGIVGGKLYYSILKGDWGALLSRAGLVWYGSFILGAILVLWVFSRRKIPLWSGLAAAAPALALGYGVGRIGCLLVGDDYGKPSTLPWAMTFPEGPIPTRAARMVSEFGVTLPEGVSGNDLVTVHPTQAYETLAAFAIFILGRWLLAGSRASAKSVGLIVIGLLAVERFLVEFLRAKDDRFIAGFTVAQLISVLILSLIVLLFFSGSRGEPASEAAA